MAKPSRWLLPAALAAAAVARRRTSAIGWNDRVVLVAGASRGLGLAIARELGNQGAHVVIAARDGQRLAAVAEELRADGVDVLAVPADVGDPEQVRTMVERAVGWRDRLDAVVNVAGVLQVAPVDTLSVADFREALDVMALGPIATTLAALPALERSDAGRVATVTSIGGKVPVPHLLPYAAAKHAAVGFSESLRAELGPRGVKVTTVVPGFMRTGSHIHAHVRGQHAREYRWFASFAEIPGIAMDADRAARRILAALARGQAEVTTTWWAPIASRAHGVAPGLGTVAAGLVGSVLPSSGDRTDTPNVEPDGEPDGNGGSRRRMAGHEVDAGLGPLDAGAERNVEAYRQQPRKGQS